MIRRLWACLLLAACSAEPRSESYFVAHPEEARRVLEACEAGAHRGDECVNAHASEREIRRRARMEMARRTFERGR
ncbi:EexN family lipoprotein [Caulobacter segnis]|uniref:EexN family lipoprotein n=1 Tax=Caulobacter segnis TaxID=88688 RepID=UPI003D69244D